MCSLLLAGLSSCNDYLDVDAPSKVTDKQVFSSTEEADRLLNAVYQSTCSGSTYGNAYLTTFNFNSDVEFSTSSAEEQSVSHNDWKQFDGEADGSSIKSPWTIGTVNAKEKFQKDAYRYSDISGFYYNASDKVKRHPIYTKEIGDPRWRTGKSWDGGKNHTVKSGDLTY